jgi:hypothetical protein
MGNTRIDIQTAIDAHFFKPLPPLSFSQKPLKSASRPQPPFLADPRQCSNLRSLQIRDQPPRPCLAGVDTPLRLAGGTIVAPETS